MWTRAADYLPRERRSAESRTPQRSNDIPTGDGSRAEINRLGVPLRREVVVVLVERAFGQTEHASECVQLGQRHIADQVCPQPPPKGPHRRIHENCHPLSLCAASVPLITRNLNVRSGTPGIHIWLRG